MHSYRTEQADSRKARIIEGVRAIPKALVRTYGDIDRADLEDARLRSYLSEGVLFPLLRSS